MSTTLENEAIATVENEATQTDWRVITLEDWALIRRLAAEGVPKRQVAQRLGISRTTVEQAVASDAPPKYERPPVPTSFTPFEPRVRALLAEHAGDAGDGARRAGRLDGVDHRGSVTTCARLRPEHRPVDPADRLVWAPGDAAQCDLWFPPRQIPLEDGTTTLLPVLVITAAHSRFIIGRMIPTRQTEDLLLGIVGADRSSSGGCRAG